jgi:magnesium transporter
MWCYGLNGHAEWLTLDNALERPLSESTWIHLTVSGTPVEVLERVKGHLKLRLREGMPRHQIQRLFKLPVDPTHDRPSLDEHEQAMFIRFWVPVGKQPDAPKVYVHLLVINQWLISLSGEPLPTLESLQKSVRRGTASWATLGTAGFAAELLDMLVDQYALLLNHVDEELMTLESHIQQGMRKLEPRLFHLQRHILQLRHTAFQHQELCYWLCNRDITVLEQAANPELVSNAYRRLYDHMSRISNWCEFARDSLTGSITIYLGLLANQTNDAMRTLTMFTVMLMPPSLIAGIYGMNFKTMPELDWVWGYPFAIVLMMTISLIMWQFFNGKKWL